MRNMRPMRALRPAISTLLLALFLMPSGCAFVGNGKVNDEIPIFYKNVADAYFIIGWEYYDLAVEVEKAGKKELAQDYYRRSKVLLEFAGELRRRALKVEPATAPSATPTARPAATEQPVAKPAAAPAKAAPAPAATPRAAVTTPKPAAPPRPAAKASPTPAAQKTETRK